MDVAAYIDGWRARAKRDELVVRDAVASARAAVPAAVETLRAAGATRVWLIGSLPRGTFRPGSDLDFMVVGLDDRAAWGASGEAARRVGIGVDVLPVERVAPHWREYHERHGELVLG